MALTGGTSVTGTGTVNNMTMQELVDSSDIEGTLIAFGIERAQKMEDLVKAKVSDMRARNAGIQELQQAMQTIRAAKPDGDDSKTSASTPEMAQAFAVLEKNGMKLPDGLTKHTDGSNASVEGKKGAFDDLLTNMQSKIDELTSNDQLDMIQLQSMVGKQNNSIEMVSNLVSKFQQLKDKIIGNMR